MQETITKTKGECKMYTIRPIIRTIDYKEGYSIHVYTDEAADSPYEYRDEFGEFEAHESRAVIEMSIEELEDEDDFHK